MMLSVRILLLFTLVGQGLTLNAAVKKQEKTQVHFTGFLGAMAKMFGGKSVDEGVTQSVAVKGNRKSTIGDGTGQIVDLDEEKLYELDIKGKSYRVTTFEELRRQFAEQRRKAEEELAKAKDAPKPQEVPPDQQMEFDFSVKESGQKKAIHGYDCKEVVLTIGVRQKGKTLEESGGMVTEMKLWLTPEIEDLKEIERFDLEYFKKLALPFDPVMAQQMAAAVAANPYLMQSMAKVQEQAAALEGTAVLTTTSFQMVQSKEQVEAASKSEESSRSNTPTSVGGLFGGLARKVIKKKAEDKDEAGSTTAVPGRSILMTSDTELLSVSTSVTDTDVAIPAGFKEKKR